MSEIETPAAQPQAQAPTTDVTDTLPEGEDWPTPVGDPTDYFPTRTIDEGVFEIGLVMGGTVSAGAYTAGVLDFLFEALDEWDRARTGGLPDVKPESVPAHCVRLRVMAGTSGGGINALLAARALHYRFPAAKEGSAAAVKTSSPNPFYEVWVNDIDITALLDNSDLNTGGKIVSILNGTRLQKIASTALGFPSPPQTAAGGITFCGGRSWAYDPLSIIVTHTNLAGVPYSQPFTGLGVSQEFFTNHADYVHLYAGSSPAARAPAANVNYLPGLSYLNVPTGAGAPATPPVQLQVVQWQDIAQNALGTSAFPVGLPARTVVRDGMHYAYRFVLDNNSGSYKWITPLWPRMAASSDGLKTYSFTSLDGGCTDNEPILLASYALEGLGNQNSAHPIKANRAIILVDPLCDPLPVTQPKSLALTDLLGPTVNMLVGANRFATADMAGFLDPDIYSRFLIAPKRTIGTNTSVVGGEALCGEGLGAFLGFMCRDFREHDFLLGRRNCQAFLRGTFSLEANNPVFVPRATPPVSAGTGPLAPPEGHCLIIPLYGSAANEEPQPNWPTGAFKPTQIRDLIKARVHLMLDRANDFLGLPLIEEFAFNSVSYLVLAPKIADKIVSLIQAELQRKGL